MRLAVWWRKHALLHLRSRHVCIVGELLLFLREWGQHCSVYLCVCDCGCVCGANLCCACQNVLVVCSPSSRGTGDVHPRLSVPLLFKSQWDIQKLSAIRTGLCRGQVGFYCAAPTLSVCAVKRSHHSSFADVKMLAVELKQLLASDLVMTEYR